MTKNTKMVSINSINDYLKQEYKENTSTIELKNENDEIINTVEVKKRIDWDSYNQFVYDVVQGCFGTYGEHKNCFIATKEDYLIRLNIIAYYTNLKITSNDVNRYKLAYSKLYEDVLEHIDMSQYMRLHEDIDSQLKYEQQIRVYQHEKEFNEAITQFNNVIDNLSSLKNIDGEQVSALLEKVSGLSDDKLIEVLRPKSEEK